MSYLTLDMERGLWSRTGAKGLLCSRSEQGSQNLEEEEEEEEEGDGEEEEEDEEELTGQQ